MDMDEIKLKDALSLFMMFARKQDDQVFSIGQGYLISANDGAYACVGRLKRISEKELVFGEASFCEINQDNPSPILFNIRRVEGLLIIPRNGIQVYMTWDHELPQ